MRRTSDKSSFSTARQTLCSTVRHKRVSCSPSRSAALAIGIVLASAST
jgi:hypothetical protein